jgi:hypothetical protein
MSSTEPAGLQRLDIDDPAAGVLAYAVRGKVTAEQGQELFSRFTRAAEEGRKLRLFYELHGFPSAEPSVYLDKLKALGTLLKTIERVAIVGDQRWLDVYTAIIDPITKADIRHFTTDERDAAVAWIRA